MPEPNEQTEQQTDQTQATDQQTDQTQATEQAQATDQQTATKPEGAPEKYEFKPPEGQTFDPEVIGAYSGVAKELNLTQEAAQKLLDTVSPVLEKRQLERIEAVRTEWTEASKADKEFGGDKLNENLAVAKTALDTFGSPALKEMLMQTGLGNHPEVIRFMYKVGQSVKPDGVVTGHRPGPGGSKSFNDIASRMYPNS